MPDQPANPGEQGNPQPGAPGNPGDGMIPKPRFDEVNERMKAAERRLAELAQAEEARTRADLEAKGKWDELKAKYEAQINELRPKAEQFESYLSTRRETLLAGLPDEHKPIANDLALDKLEQYVQLHGKPPAAPAPRPAGQPGQAPVQTEPHTPEQIKKGVREGGLAWFRENVGGSRQ